MVKYRDQDLIFEDFIHDREIKMYKRRCQDTAQCGYLLLVQMFTLDNLPFSPMTGDAQHVFFDFDEASTDKVKVTGVVGNEYNEVTKRYEVTDRTFVVAEMDNSKLSERVAIRQMQEAAEKVITELNKKRPMPVNMARPHILTDVQRAAKLLTDRNVKITKLSRETNISTYTLYNYRKNPESLKKASHATINCLVNKYYDTYFSRNEIEHFRRMLIKIVGAYLKETQDNPIAYNPAYALYMMCQKGDWHRLARMEELWQAGYIMEK